MALMTRDEYIASQGRMKKRAFIMGQEVENLTLGPGAAAYLTESMHGAGSPQAQRIMLAQLADMEEKMQWAKRLAGIIRT